MDPERWQQIERLYYAALELEESQQAVFLREVCGADASLRREVESLLAWNKRAEDFLKLPAIELAARDLARDADESLTGKTANILDRPAADLLADSTVTQLTAGRQLGQHTRSRRRWARVGWGWSTARWTRA